MKGTSKQDEYQCKLAAFDELKKSLQQAFNGELIKDNGQ